MRLSGVGEGSLAGGCVLRHRVLAEKAVYRVLQAGGQVVEVEVVAVPGLQPGTRLRLTAAVAKAMRAAPGARLDRLRQGVGLPA